MIVNMEEKNKNNSYKYFMVAVITALTTCIVTTIVVYNSVKNNNTLLGRIGTTITNTLTGNQEQNINQKISEIKQKLNEVYIGEIDEKKLIEGALEGYVDAVGDEYTDYITEDELTELMQEVNGSYVGVGIYIAQTTTNQILVIGVIEDSPAHKAGILTGDFITKVDNIEYSGEQLTIASNKMKGIEGTTVKITVQRNEKEINFDITRSTIKFKCIKSEKLEDNIGYIKISSFDGGCAQDFENAYNELKQEEINSLIIDLRNNGGGLVDQSLAIAELIVPKGSKMLITKDKNGNEEISTSKAEPIVDIPIVILVNEYTASASEILTAAIKENVESKVVGTQTFGKGIIQGIFVLSDQKTAMKITMQEYFTPNYNKIHKTGVTPDEIIELPEQWKGQSTVEREFDTQLNKAIELLK